MRYRVEYLVESTEEETVCWSIDTRGTLEAAGWQARVQGEKARREYGAGGFQIRDLTDRGCIVALETFDDPLSCFAPDAGQHVIH